MASCQPGRSLYPFVNSRAFAVLARVITAIVRLQFPNLLEVDHDILKNIEVLLCDATTSALYKLSVLLYPGKSSQRAQLSHTPHLSHMLSSLTHSALSMCSLPTMIRSLFMEAVSRMCTRKIAKLEHYDSGNRFATPSGSVALITGEPVEGTTMVWFEKAWHSLSRWFDSWRADIESTKLNNVEQVLHVA